VQGGFLLDVVVREGTTIFQLLASKDQPLLIGRDAFLVLDLGLHILNGVTGLDFQGDGLASQGLHEDLHPTPETKHQVQGGFLLDIVVREGASIFQLLAGKNEPLLVWGNALLVLDLGLHILNGVTGFHLESDGLASEGFHEDLHPPSQAQHQVQGGFLLDVVIRKSAPIFQLLASKDQPLLIRRDAFLVLDLGLHILNGVTGLNFQGDGLTSQGLHKDLHPTPETKHQVQGGFLLDIVVREGASIFQLLAGKNEPLLVWGNALLVLDLGLHILNGVTGFHLESDGLA
ncbi:hypothetical protein N302_07741, partial [Corvus brachyrhynchos]